MAHLVQKGSDEYIKLGKKCLQAFVLATAAATSLVGCVGLGDGLVNTSYNLSNTATDQLTRGGKWLLGSDEVCARNSQMNVTRNNGSANNTVGVRGNCIEPQKLEKYDLEMLKSQERQQLGQAEINAKLQKIQAENSAKLREEQMDREQQLRLKQACLDKELQAVRDGKEISPTDPCVLRGDLKVNANGIVMPAKKDAPAAPKQPDEPGPMQKFLKSTFGTPSPTK